MPWAAPIGTGQGPRNPRALRELRERAPNIPLIIDAGIGLPSHACQAMEWGFDGVFLNTAVSRADDPVWMAGAFASTIKAGHDAFVAGPMIVQDTAVPSTPEIGRPFGRPFFVNADSKEVTATSVPGGESNETDCATHPLPLFSARI
jgi:thiazole synthase